MEKQYVRNPKTLGGSVNDKSRIIVAADNMDLHACRSLARRVGHLVHAIKINDVFDNGGGEIVADLSNLSARVWVDVKLHDIPNTVKNRAKILDGAGANIISVHALGGIEMMAAAVDAVRAGTEIYAVTMLTSHDPAYVMDMYNRTVEEQVIKLALMAQEAGVHGLVCSPKELAIIKKYPQLDSLELITPGVRSAGADVGDQKRVDTPRAAIEAGATYIVVGRQVTEASDPVAALKAIEAEIADVV